MRILQPTHAPTIRRTAVVQFRWRMPDLLRNRHRANRRPYFPGARRDQKHRRRRSITMGIVDVGSDEAGVRRDGSAHEHSVQPADLRRAGHRI